MDYELITIKFVVGMLALILQINLFGKKNLAPTSAIDQVQNYVLGAILGGIIYNEAISVMQFAVILLIWTLVVFVIKVLKERFYWARMLVDGRPVSVIKNGKINTQNCVKQRISANEIMMNLRARGVQEVSQVKSAIVDQSGQFVVITYGEESLRFPLIVDGQLNQDVLELIDKPEEWVLEELEAKGISEIRDVFLAEYTHGELTLTPYPGNKK
ncbi:MAG: DUF421 domain-containing protein [Lactobacillus sp.]|nr:DUF421 domain-containing protein [Lactobacillus sp.]